MNLPGITALGASLELLLDAGIENVEFREIPFLYESVVTGYIDDAQRSILAALVKGTGARTFFEIGTSLGRTTWTVAHHNPELEIYTLDVPPEGEADQTVFELGAEDRAYFRPTHACGEAFRADEDIHKATGRDLFGVAISDVTSDQRRLAKTINFATIYGLSAAGLAVRTDLSNRAAADFIKQYFDRYPGVWRHGDWILITDRGSAVISGRSDATINRGGIRMGTAELYRSALNVEAVTDALAVDVEDQILLFIVADDADGDGVQRELRARIRHDCSPRHVPDRIIFAPDIPRTISGKVLEVPIKKLLRGAPADEVVSRDSLANPGAFDWFVAFAKDAAAAAAASAP